MTADHFAVLLMRIPGHLRTAVFEGGCAAQGAAAWPRRGRAEGIAGHTWAVSAASFPQRVPVALSFESAPESPSDIAGGAQRSSASSAMQTGRFACRDCGNVICLHNATLSIPKDEAWREALLDADLQVVGRCPSRRTPGGKKKTRRKRKSA